MIAALTVAAMVAAPTAQDVDVTRFLNACLDGKLAVEKAKSHFISYTELPSGLRNWYDHYKNTLLNEKYVEFLDAPQSYLISFERKPILHRYARVCAVASRSIKLPSSVGAVLKAIEGREADATLADKLDKATNYSNTFPERGFAFSANKERGFVILQISWLNPDQVKDWCDIRPVRVGK